MIKACNKKLNFKRWIYCLWHGSEFCRNDWFQMDRPYGTSM